MTTNRIPEQDAGTFHILCRVSGGVTGTREALLKEAGRVSVYTSRKAAQNHADSLNAINRRSFATFSYRVIEAGA